MVRDVYIGYSWLHAAQTTDSATAASVLLDWTAPLGAPRERIFDDSSYFRNMTNRLLNKGFWTPNHLTLPYCP